LGDNHKLGFTDDFSLSHSQNKKSILFVTIAEWLERKDKTLKAEAERSGYQHLGIALK
jgi:hypothetical protein